MALSSNVPGTKVNTERPTISDAAAALASGDDAGVARRLGARHERAFGERAHNRLLYRLARSILRSDAEAEDAVQEAYRRLPQHRQLSGRREAIDLACADSPQGGQLSNRAVLRRDRCGPFGSGGRCATRAPRGRGRGSTTQRAIELLAPRPGLIFARKTYEHATMIPP